MQPPRHRPLAAQNHWPAGAQQHSGTTRVRSGRTFAAVRRAAPFELEPRAAERLLDGRQVVRQDAEAPAHRVAGCRAACAKAAVGLAAIHSGAGQGYSHDAEAPLERLGVAY